MICHHPDGRTDGRTDGNHEQDPLMFENDVQLLMRNGEVMANLKEPDPLCTTHTRHASLATFRIPNRLEA